MINMKRLLVICMLVLHTILVSSQSINVFSIEAASPDPTLSVRGPETTIDFINDYNWAKKQIVLHYSLLNMIKK